MFLFISASFSQHCLWSWLSFLLLKSLMLLFDQLLGFLIERPLKKSFPSRLTSVDLSSLLIWGMLITQWLLRNWNITIILRVILSDEFWIELSCPMRFLNILKWKHLSRFMIYLRWERILCYPRRSHHYFLQNKFNWGKREIIMKISIIS